MHHLEKKYAPNIVLLLTGTVNVNAMRFTTLTDADARRNDYIRAVRHYLTHFPFPVVFVENSGAPMAGYFEKEIQAGRLEVLGFEGNNYDTSYGKGYGEMRCIEYAAAHSRFIREESFVFKITGRYVIDNAHRFFAWYSRYPQTELMADLTNNFRWSASAIVGFRPFFAKTYLFKNAELINDSKEFSFEHALAKAVLEAIGGQVNFQLFRYYPKLRAISGTTGRPYRKSFFYMLPRQLKYLVRYYILIR
jgi:hypothetical protein